MSVQVKIDDSVFRKKIAEYKKSVGVALPKITKCGGNKYADESMKFVPPKKSGEWSKAIDSKAYKRPYFYLPQLIKDEKNQAIISILSRELNKGNRFATFKQSWQNRRKMWFFATTERTIKKYTKIIGRGLLKVMFGANLYSVGVPIPNAIAKILNKSPKLRKMINMNTVKMNYKVNESAELLTSNEATAKLGYNGQYAIKKGCYKARKEMVKLMKQTVNEVQKKWNS